MKIYHASSVPNLKILEPRVGTHGKGWVYATKNLTTALLFGANWSDFDFLLAESNGRIELCETHPGVFEKVYKNKSCSVYELEDSGFKEKQTSWHAEIVSENPTKILKEIVVTDLRKILEEEIEKKNLTLHRFQNTKEYKAKISKHIVDRLIRFNKLNGEIKPELMERFGGIIEMLQKTMSGDYLNFEQECEKEQGKR